MCLFFVIAGVQNLLFLFWALKLCRFFNLSNELGVQLPAVDEKEVPQCSTCLMPVRTTRLMLPRDQQLKAVIHTPVTSMSVHVLVHRFHPDNELRF